jgi:solute carrier family 8 (sodium/calcium exchanger)
MGLPWLIVTFYKLAKTGESANVPAGDLAFSVIVFLCCSMCCFAVLLLRRIIIGGELGGPVVSKYITAGICVGLWCIYIILCTLKAYNFIEIGKEE